MSNASGGLLIALSDERRLDLYLTERLYAPHVGLAEGEHPSPSAYYRTLANYACARTNTHVFFLLKRKVVYGGRTVGSGVGSSLYLNGDAAWLGMKTGAPLVWDESHRYAKTERRGVFLARGRRKFQPIVVLLRESPELTRKVIPSEELYINLGRFPYLLPSMVTSDAGEWTLTPGETRVALDLLHAAPDIFDPLGNEEEVVKRGNPTLFDIKDGIQDLGSAYQANEILSASHLHFSIISSPTLLPREMRPSVSDVICRQVPMSPPKPYRVDRGQVCYYDTRGLIGGGTLPNRVILVEDRPAGASTAERVDRCLKWLAKVTPAESQQRIRMYVFAPRLEYGALTYRSQFKGQVCLADFSGNLIEL